MPIHGVDQLDHGVDLAFVNKNFQHMETNFVHLNSLKQIVLNEDKFFKAKIAINLPWTKNRKNSSAATSMEWTNSLNLAFIQKGDKLKVILIPKNN